MESAGTRGFWLSPQQKRVWSLQPNGCVSRAICVVGIEGSLDVERLEHALRRIVARNEALRTVFRRQPGMTFPFQVVLESDVPVLEAIDLCSVDAAAQDSEVEELVTKQQALEPCPEHGPALRAILANLSPNRSVLILSLPALSSDSQSLRILIHEIGLFVSGTEDQVAEEALRYVQFAQWQCDLLESEDDNAQEGRKFWEARAGDLPSPTLPLEQKTLEHFSPEVWSSVIGRETCQKIETVSASVKSSVADVLLAAWQSLVWRLTGQATFKIGAIFDGRQFEELQGAVGLFEKTLPVDSRFDGDFRFREVVAHVTAAIGGATDWQEHFAPGSGFENEPPVSFEFVEDPGPRKFGDLEFSIRRCSTCTEHYKLKLSAVRSDKGLTLNFGYDGSRLDREAVGRMAGISRGCFARLSKTQSCWSAGCRC